MHPLQHHVDIGGGGFIIAKNVERFCRPENVPVGDMPAETAGAAQALPLAQISLAAL